MELRHLRHFVVLAEERHFLRAANRLHIVQSGLSKCIRSLEEELGTPLFVRTTRRVELTQAGEALLVSARRVLAEVRAAQETVAAVQGVLRGTLKLGFTRRHLITGDLFNVLTEFHKTYPGVQFSIIQNVAAIVIESLRSGDLDIAILSQAIPTPKEFTTQLLCRERLLFGLPPNHPLARRNELTLAALEKEDFLDFQPGVSIRIMADRIFAAAGVQRKRTAEVSNLHSMLDFIEVGMGIGIVPESVRMPPRHIILVPPKPALPPWDTRIAYVGQQPPNPAARAFLELLQQSCKMPTAPDAAARPRTR